MAIHAATTPDESDRATAAIREHVRRDPGSPIYRGDLANFIRDMELGAITGSAAVTDIHHASNCPGMTRERYGQSLRALGGAGAPPADSPCLRPHDGRDRWHAMLDRHVPLTDPVPAPNGDGLWTVDDTTVDVIVASLPWPTH